MKDKYRILIIRIYSIFISLAALNLIIQAFNLFEEYSIYLRFISFILGAAGLFLSINLFRLKEFARKGIIILLSTYLVFPISTLIVLGVAILKYGTYSQEWAELMFGLIIFLAGFIMFLAFYFASLYFFTRKSVKGQFK